MTPYHVAHGYTLQDLNEIAAAACRADRSLASDAHTRYDIAWSAIADHLCAAEEPPARAELVRVGWQAIYNEVREMRHTFGFRDKDGTNGVASSPRFVQYWTQPPVRPEAGIIERLAVGQILTTLRPAEREAVIALAAHDDYGRAADALGISYTALTVRLSNGRRRFRAHWFAPETAPPVKGTDRRVGSYTKAPRTHCGRGHELSGDNVYWRSGSRPGKRGERACRACETERSKARWQRRKAGLAREMAS